MNNFEILLNKFKEDYADVNYKFENGKIVFFDQYSMQTFEQSPIDSLDIQLEYFAPGCEKIISSLLIIFTYDDETFYYRNSDVVGGEFNDEQEVFERFCSCYKLTKDKITIEYVANTAWTEDRREDN